MKKWIFIVIAVVVVGFIGYQWVGSKTKAQQVPIQVRTAVVQKGKFEVKVSGSGTVQPVTSVDINSTINNNQIDEVLVTAGQTVKKGDVLITFEDGSDPITAPADGVVTTLSVQAGERVTSGQVVAHLTNYTDLQTVAPIDELDISKVSAGQTATVKVNAVPDQTFNGTVTAVANEGSSTNGVSSFDVTVHIDNPSGLKVGMSTETSILTASKDNALLVPVDAVHSINGEKFVLLATSDQNNQTSQSDNQNNQSKQFNANSRKVVKTGLANEDYVEITDGLTEGETVLLPNLATGTSSNNAKMMQGGFGGLGGGMNGMGRQFRNGGNGGFGGNGGGNRQAGGGSAGGRSGN